jgi:hypothetical protein
VERGFPMFTLGLSARLTFEPLAKEAELDVADIQRPATMPSLVNL